MVNMVLIQITPLSTPFWEFLKDIDGDGVLEWIDLSFLLPFGSFGYQQHQRQCSTGLQTSFLLPFGSFPQHNYLCTEVSEPVKLSFYSLLGVSCASAYHVFTAVPIAIFLLPFGSFRGQARTSRWVRTGWFLSTPFWEFRKVKLFTALPDSIDVETFYSLLGVSADADAGCLGMKLYLILTFYSLLGVSF